MADLSKIKLNGTEYDLKDAIARAGLVTAELDANVIAMMANLGYAVPVTDEDNEPLSINDQEIMG